MTGTIRTFNWKGVFYEPSSQISLLHPKYTSFRIILDNFAKEIEEQNSDEIAAIEL